MTISKQHYHILFEKVYCEKNKPILLKISEIVNPRCDDISKNFYNIMLGNSKAAHFINHDIVKNRLSNSMSAWIERAFIYKDDKEIDEYIEYQLKIGHVHGRIDLPMTFVNYGMFLIKNDIMQLLSDSSLDKNDLASAISLSSQILDIGLALINESYQGDLVLNEKEAQSFKLHFSSHNLAFDCERLRASLSEWMRELLLSIHQDRSNIENLPTIRHSNFGLWVVHKSKLFLAESEYEILNSLLNNIDESMLFLTKNFSDSVKMNEALSLLDTYISKAMWLLEDIAKEIINQDSGRDPLTRLFNRRYLDTVLRHETECSLKNDLIFGLVMIDIDFFKKINDSHGHDNGDKVLAQLADILINQVRAGDFVFRLGGEEFLIVLSDINQPALERIGENIRLKVENTEFIIAQKEHKQNLTITVSIGVAIHDGHPDFLRTLKIADEAIYEAKRNGRNRVVVANTPVMTYGQLDVL